MKNVYQPKIETQDALMCHILDAAVPDASYLLNSQTWGCVLRLRVVMLNIYCKFSNKNAM
jgi:hypothetical protein